MKLIIRLAYGAQTRAPKGRNRQAALVASSLLAPLAFMAWALGVWRLAADLKWAGAFAITSGLFSHWQVWIALGIMLQLGSFLLHRLAARREGGNATV